MRAFTCKCGSHHRKAISADGVDKARSYSAKELADRDYNIDLCGYPHGVVEDYGGWSIMSRMNEPDFLGAIYEVLSKRYGVDEKIFDIISPDYDEDRGNDDFHYGWYTQIPALDDLDDNIISDITKLLLAKIPFGETEYISDADLSSTKADPLNALVEYYEYQDYLALSFTKELISQLEEIEVKIRTPLQTGDELTVKALVFSAFSLTESHVRDHVWGVIPNIDKNVSNEVLRLILKRHFSDKLQRADETERIYKEFTGKRLGAIPHREPFRNVLAHDIGAGKLEGNLLVVNDKSGKEQKMDIFEIISDLKIYWENLRTHNELTIAV